MWEYVWPGKHEFDYCYKSPELDQEIARDLDEKAKWKKDQR